MLLSPKKYVKGLRAIKGHTIKQQTMTTATKVKMRYLQLHVQFIKCWQFFSLN